MRKKEIITNIEKFLLNAQNKTTFENMEKWIDKKQFENIMTETTPETKKLYFNVCNYNQALILNNFIKMLFEKFNDKMLLNSEYHEKILIDTQNPEETKQNFLYLGFTGSIYASFIIENYLYYIQFDPNPFFDNSSYITCQEVHRIKKDFMYKNYKNKLFCFTCYGGGYNINDLFNIYKKNLNIEEATKQLYNYFMEKNYKTPNATDNTRRIAFLNPDKNTYNIKVLEKDF